MQIISEFLAADHARCDQLYADGESALLTEIFKKDENTLLLSIHKFVGISVWKKKFCFLRLKWPQA